MSTLTVGTIAEKVTDAGVAVDGVTLKDGTVTANRLSSDGTIIDLQKDGTSIGNIGVANTDQLSIGTPDGSEMGLRFDGDLQHILPANATGAKKDASADLGSSTARWQNLYLSGGAYLGGTGSANYLQDYEEGTATIAISDGTTSSSTTQQCYYVKVGRIVKFSGFFVNIVTTGMASSSSIRIPLPIASGTAFAGGSAQTENVGSIITDNATMSSGRTAFCLRVVGGQDYATVREYGTATGDATLTVGELNSGVTDMFFQITYFAD